MSILRTLKNPKSWLITAISSLIICALTVFAATEADQDLSREYHLKAAFLRYVATFVTWPKGAITQESINICLYGDVPNLQGLNSINGRMIENLPILVRPITNLDTAKKECQILYIMKSKQAETNTIVKKFKGLPVLTFGDGAEFAQEGGAMNFYVANNRMAIVINQKTVSEAKLTIQPRMLRLVTIIPGDQNEAEEMKPAA